MPPTRVLMLVLAIPVPLWGCQDLRSSAPDAPIATARADGPGRDAPGVPGPEDASRESVVSEATPEPGDATGPSDADAAVCNPGQTRCALGAEKVEVCTVAGVWAERETCAAICQDGACVGTCRPGERHCGRDQTPEVCTAAGAWSPEARCPFVCGGAGLCGGSCLPGSKRCGGPNQLTPEVCDENGSWTVAGQACAHLCSHGSCGGSCAPGTRRCGANQTPELCGAQAAWQPGERCTFVCSGEGQCTGECRPGARRCTGASGRSPQLCDEAGRWTAAGADCPNVCTDGQCRGVCSPGSRRCGANQAFETCGTDGAWQPSGRCQFVCTGNGECTGECGRDADCGTCRVCSGNRCQNADNGRAGPGCSAPASCSGGTAREADLCQNGQCQQGRSRSCAPYSCSGSVCATRCPDGSVLCGGQCVSGTCCGHTDCGTCQECVSNQCRNQSAGSDRKNECGGRGCVNGRCRVCTPRASECVGGTFRTCNADGTGYSNQQTCMHGCNASGTCNSCSGTSRRCNGDLLETCTNGAWVGSLCPPKRNNFGTDMIDGTCDPTPTPHCSCKPRSCTCFDIDSSGTSCGDDGEEHTVNCTSLGSDYTCDNAADNGVCVDSNGGRIKPMFCP